MAPTERDGGDSPPGPGTATHLQRQDGHRSGDMTDMEHPSGAPVVIHALEHRPGRLGPNADAWAIDASTGLYAVADGMGATSAARAASQAAIADVVAAVTSRLAADVT